MGILSALLGDKNPIGQWANQNSNWLGAVGAGLGNGLDTSQLGEGKKLDYMAQQQRDADAKVVAQANSTKTWLQQHHPDLAQMVDAGMPVAEAWQTALQRDQPQAPEKPQNPYMAAGDGTFLNWQTGDFLKNPYAAQDPKVVQEGFNREKDLFGQYSNADPVKTYEVVKGAYERVRQGAQLDTGAGDMGLIYGFMKLNDPGSVVRESEFAMAAQAGDFGQQIQGMVNRVLTGERLTPKVRQEFVQAAEKLYAESAGNLSTANTQFGDRATGFSIDPSHIIRQPEAYEPLALGQPETKVVNGKTYFKDGNGDWYTQ